VYLAIALLLLWWWQAVYRAGDIRTISYSDFKAAVARGDKTKTVWQRASRAYDRN
jgi:hypothetical protein